MTEFIQWRNEIWRRHLWAWYQRKQIPKTPRTPKPDRGSIRYLTGGKHIRLLPADDEKKKRRLASRAKHAARRAQRCKPLSVHKLFGEKWPTMGYQAIDRLSRQVDQGKRAHRRFVKKKGALIIRTFSRGMRSVSL